MTFPRPAKPFRILRPSGKKGVIAFTTKNARDEAGEKYAALDGTPIHLEVWSEGNCRDHAKQGWACDRIVNPPGYQAAPVSEATDLLRRIRDVLVAVDDATADVEAADVEAADSESDEVRALHRRDDLIADLLEPVEALDKLLSEGGALPGPWTRRGAPSAETYEAVTPAAGDELRVQEGASIGDLVVVGIAVPNPHEVSHCLSCSQAFNNDLPAVLVRYPDDEKVNGLHEHCAARYAQESCPIVVTIRADGTATVAGPPRTTVTVLIEQ